MRAFVRRAGCASQKGEAPKRVARRCRSKRLTAGPDREQRGGLGNEPAHTLHEHRRANTHGDLRKRAGEEIAALRAAGIDVEVIPGVTAASAASASLSLGRSRKAT